MRYEHHALDADSKAATMTADEFYAAMGTWPQDDDLERANCEQAGMAGHTACGICEHGKPVFLCGPCFIATANKPFKLAH